MNTRLLAPTSRKFVAEPIPRSQHWPIGIQLTAVITPNKTPFKRKFNFAKADWPAFTGNLDGALTHLSADSKNYESFINIVKKVSRRHNPRGCRTTYIPSIDEESSQLLGNYTTTYNTDPFIEDIINLGEELISRISQRHRQMWQQMIETIDLRHLELSNHSLDTIWGKTKQGTSKKKRSRRAATVLGETNWHQQALNRGIWRHHAEAVILQWIENGWNGKVR